MATGRDQPFALDRTNQTGLLTHELRERLTSAGFLALSCNETFPDQG